MTDNGKQITGIFCRLSSVVSSVKMKVTIRQYAESLYESVVDKTADEIKSVIKKFVGILKENNDFLKIEKILNEFIKIWDRNHGVVEAEVTSARELDKDVLKLVKDYVEKLSGAKEVALTEKVDKSILGGVVIKYEDQVMDGSLKARIKELKENMIK